MLRHYSLLGKWPNGRRLTAREDAKVRRAALVGRSRVVALDVPGNFDRNVIAGRGRYKVNLGIRDVSASIQAVAELALKL